MSIIVPTQIANRALQRVGSPRIAAGALLTENSIPADEIRACYDIIRRAELRRNVWRFSIRVLSLRAIDGGTQFVTFGTWLAGTTYAINDVVTGSDGQYYYSLVSGNVGNDPTVSPLQWALYFGTDSAVQFTAAFSALQIYNVNQIAQGSNGVVYVSLVNNNFGNDPTVAPPLWLVGTIYSSGNFVTASDGNIYQSLLTGNIGFNPVTDGGVHWLKLSPSIVTNTIGWALSTSPNTQPINTQSFFAGELVYTLGPIKVWLSLVNNNRTSPVTDTSGSWLAFTTAPTLAPPNFIYPLGSGPSSDTTTRNAFRLPVGFLREAPQEPKAQTNAFLGGPAGLRADDWNFENFYLTSFDPGPIVFRFAADIADVRQFDTLFIEGFSCRIALEVCERLTQSREKLEGIGAEYKKFMGEARAVNGIETGYEEPPLDEYISVRV